MWVSTVRGLAAQQVTEDDLPGYPIGGVSVGEPPAWIHRIVQTVTP